MKLEIAKEKSMQLNKWLPLSSILRAGALPGLTLSQIAVKSFYPA